jgi:hypothetical protein
MNIAFSNPSSQIDSKGAQAKVSAVRRYCSGVMGGKVTRECSNRLHAVGFAKAPAETDAVVPGAATPLMAGGASHKASVLLAPTPTAKN